METMLMAFKRWPILLFISSLLFSSTALSVTTCKIRAPVLAISGGPIQETSTTTASGAKFKVFDALLQRDKPNLSALGMEKINVVYEVKLFNLKASPPSMEILPNAAKAVALEAPTTGVTVLDVERWHGLGNARDRYAGLINEIRSFRPDLQLGYFGVVPKGDYWRAITGIGHVHYNSWQAENTSFQNVSDCVDAMFPAVYTFYADRAGWIKQATAAVAEARRIAAGKPVYAFMWYRYHDSNKALKGVEIPSDVWLEELNTMKKLADGVVIWGGYLEKWNENAKWWKATKQFLTTIEH